MANEKDRPREEQKKRYYIEIRKDHKLISKHVSVDVETADGVTISPTCKLNEA